MKFAVFLLTICLIALPTDLATAQSPWMALVVQNCGSQTYPAGTIQANTQDTTGAYCGSKTAPNYALVVTSCGVQNYPIGTIQPVTQDETGTLC